MPTSSSEDAWLKLGVLLKAVYAEFGGGEEYLRSERERFDDDSSPTPQENK
jgi:hypothetical protein